MAIKPLRSARALKDCEHKKPELVFKLRLFHHGVEQGSNCGGKQSVSPAAEGAEDKGILAVGNTHAEDRADLVEHDFFALRGKAAVLCLVGKFVNARIVGLAVEAKGRHCDNVALEGIFLEVVEL